MLVYNEAQDVQAHGYVIWHAAFAQVVSVHVLGRSGVKPSSDAEWEALVALTSTANSTKPLCEYMDRGDLG